MGPWSLVDFSKPADGPEDFPRTAICSEEHLRRELDRLRQREPAIVGLEPERNEALQIGIGGPFVGVRYYVGGHVRCVLLADPRVCPQGIEFQAEEDVLVFWPDELMPVEQAIEIITHYYRTGSLPDGANGKEWDPKAMAWRTRAEVAALPNGAPALPPVGHPNPLGS